MASFGHEEDEARSVVIAGGGSIGMMLSREIETHFSNTHNQIIELDPARARQLAQELENTDIINGDALDSAILREAGVHTTETFVAVMKMTRLIFCLLCWPNWGQTCSGAGEYSGLYSACWYAWS